MRVLTNEESKQVAGGLGFLVFLAVSAYRAIIGRVVIKHHNKTKPSPNYTPGKGNGNWREP